MWMEEAADGLVFFMGWTPKVRCPSGLGCLYSPFVRFLAVSPKRAPRKSTTKSANRTSPPKRRQSKRAGSKRATGRAGTAQKGDADVLVRAFIASLPPWQRGIAERFDKLVAREVPGVKRAMKWSAPFYGLEGRGWFAAFGAFKAHVKVNFFKGTSLKPVPPRGESGNTRAVDLRSLEEYEAAPMKEWVRQAARLPAWGA